MKAKRMKRNKVCDVLMKDKAGSYKQLFAIEGDRIDDSSLYIIKNNHINPEVDHDEDHLRNFALQKSYHSSVGKDGLVQTHTKRDGKRFGVQRQVAITDRKIPLCAFHHNNDDVGLYPEKEPEKNDILLTINPDYISYYNFIFYTKKEGLEKYLVDHNEYSLQECLLPLAYVDGVSVAVSISIDRLKEIQRSKIHMLNNGKFN